MTAAGPWLLLCSIPAGQFSTHISILLQIRAAVINAAYSWALSFWNMQDLSWKRCHLAGSIYCSEPAFPHWEMCASPPLSSADDALFIYSKTNWFNWPQWSAHLLLHTEMPSDSQKFNDTVCCRGWCISSLALNSKWDIILLFYFILYKNVLV